MNMEKFFGVDVRSGDVVKTRIPIAEYNDGSPVSLPVFMARGQKDGPTVYVQAGIHGDELTAIEICRQFIARIDVSEISGTVVAVPVANVPAHTTRTRGFLHEERWMIDANRVFPGSAHGLLTERIVAGLFENFICQADMSVDLHSALDGCDIMPFVYLGNPKTHVAAEAFGTELLYTRTGTTLGTSDMSRSIDQQATKRGALCFSAEMGESRRVSHEYVETGVRGLFNVLAHMGMLQRAPVLPPTRTRFDRIAPVHTNRGGGLRMLVKMGTYVERDQPIAHVTDVFGDVTETVVAPDRGLILRAMRLGNVATGAEIAWVVNAQQ